VQVLISQIYVIDILLKKDTSMPNANLSGDLEAKNKMKAMNTKGVIVLHNRFFSFDQIAVFWMR
jgi:hypothetical protein